MEDELTETRQNIAALQWENVRLNQTVAKLSQSQPPRASRPTNIPTQSSVPSSQNPPRRVLFNSTSDFAVRTSTPIQIVDNSLGETSRQPPASPRRNHNELEARIRELEELVTRIPKVSAPLSRIERSSYADSPFEDHISMGDMPEKFAFPSMKLFDGTTDPDDHITHYKQ